MDTPLTRKILESMVSTNLPASFNKMQQSIFLFGLPFLPGGTTGYGTPDVRERAKDLSEAGTNICTETLSFKRSDPYQAVCFQYK
jgi:hypothetical protein